MCVCVCVCGGGGGGGGGWGGEFRSMWLFIVNSLLLFWFLRKIQDLNAEKNRKLCIFELMGGNKKGFKFLLLFFSMHVISQTNKAIWLYLTFFLSHSSVFK